MLMLKRTVAITDCAKESLTVVNENTPKHRPNNKLIVHRSEIYKKKVFNSFTVICDNNRFLQTA